MKVLLSWLREFAPFDQDPDLIGDTLSDLGTPVEEVTRLGEGLDGIVVARVLALRAHPNADKIQLVDVDRGITFGHLAATIEQFTRVFFGKGFTSRLRPAYFPFTEPSAEFDVQRPDGTWLELGGCGMVHPNVLRNGGIDPETWSGFAFGFGLDRLATTRQGIPDLRELTSPDIRFLQQI